MTYIDTETGEYPLFIGDLMLKTNLPADAAAQVQRYQKVEDTPLPTWTKTDRLIELAPVFENGTWKKQFLVRPETEEEAADRIKREQEMTQNPFVQNLNTAGSTPDVIG